MHKLSQNLGKVSKNQPKIEVGRFFLGQNIGPVRRAGEKKAWILIIFTCGGQWQPTTMNKTLPLEQCHMFQH